MCGENSMGSGIPTKQSTSSDLESQELSEPIIVLGKGVPAFNTRYGCLTQCAAGIEADRVWIRLHPLFVEQIIPRIRLVNKFDIIQVEYREKKPEPTRPETRKIHPESIVILSHIRDRAKQKKILERNTESGSFLHDGSWNGKKTLGMIEPLEPRFFASNSLPKVRFFCRASCNGHTCEVGEFEKFDDFGRIIPEAAQTLENRMQKLEEEQIRFVMGTDRRHPHVWLLVSINII
jgi:hypothetical protein